MSCMKYNIRRYTTVEIYRAACPVRIALCESRRGVEVVVVKIPTAYGSEVSLSYRVNPWTSLNPRSEIRYSRRGREGRRPPRADLLGNFQLMALTE